MYRRLWSSLAVRAGRLLAVVALGAAGGAVVLAPPAAAVPAPMFVWTEVVGAWGVRTSYCLDQHYAGSMPTTTMYAWAPCHSGGNNSPGNQLWSFEHLGGNVFRIMNKRAGYTWCLSAPNGNNSEVFAEYCVTSPQIPNKQRWYAADVGGWNILQARSTSGECMSANITTANGGRMKMAPCTNAPGQLWSWNTPA